MPPPKAIATLQISENSAFRPIQPAPLIEDVQTRSPHASIIVAGHNRQQVIMT
jgi:hypothetical protein